MNGDSPPNPQVPVTTLPGITNITELLPDLPLPSECEKEKNRSLLFHPRVAEEAQRHLACQDKNLVSQLASAIAGTSADDIQLKDQYAKAPSDLDLETAPPLLKEILIRNALVFSKIVPLGIEANGEKSNQNVTLNQNSLTPVKTEAELKSSKPVVFNQYHPLMNPEEDDKKGLEKMHNLSNGTELDSQPTTKSSRSMKELTYEAAKGVKAPFVVLNKLSSQDLKATTNAATPNKNTPKPKYKNDLTPSSRRKDAKKYVEVSSSESEDEKKPVKYFKSREREREEKRRRDKADRKRKAYSEDEEYNPEMERKKAKTEEASSEEESGSEEEKKKGTYNMKITPLKKPEYNRKKIERKLVPAVEKLSQEDIMESGVYNRFNRAVEKIFDNTEDLDLAAELDEDGDVPQEFLIPKYELADLCSETAKLKNLGAMSIVPSERLVRLLNILEKNIRDGTKVTPVVDEDDCDDDKLWLDVVMERIIRGVDACLTAMYIMTADRMDKKIYLEDVIEKCVQFTKFQLTNTIYPIFDPVYRIDGKKEIFLGSMRRKRAQAKDVRDKNILFLYNKLHELVGLLADLLGLQTLTDTTVLILSSVGVAPFFVENVSELQLSSLKLVTKIFLKYERHRRLLLDDILASIARLPSSKRSLRTYRVSSDENIQMLTALVLQLIQCVVELPLSLCQSGKDDGTVARKALSKDISKSDKVSAKEPKCGESSETKGGESSMDRDVLICTRYEAAMGTAFSFLSVFLQKTGSKSEEIDYRPLFENFVQDLLLTVNKPEWPASELLLSLLGKLLVQKFSDKSSDMTLRVASLDCLGVVAARLRKDTVTSHLKVDTINQVISDIKDEETKFGPFQDDGSTASAQENGSCSSSSKKNKKKGNNSTPTKSFPVDIPVDEEEERTIFLQRVLLDWLAVNSETDAALLNARHFYIGQWYCCAYKEILRLKLGPIIPKQSSKKSAYNKRKRRKKGESEEEDSDESEEEEKNDEVCDNVKMECTQLAERRKTFLIQKIPAFPPASPGTRIQSLQTHLDYENAELITRYLASKRPFSQSFDIYLKQILRVLTESAIAIRTKAMKCLTMVVEADPSVLARRDMQLGVHHSFLDHSTSVREAAVDLVGKFVLSRPELLDKYYDMMAARILDTGVSVRKRVIKIMKDICFECPDFHKIPEICVKMIRRVSDEEGIKKLVQEVFQTMWFTPVREKPLDQDHLIRKVNNITDVVISCRETGLDWFEQLLTSMFKPREDKDNATRVNTEPPKALVTACRQIVDCLVKHILLIEESSCKKDGDSPGEKGGSSHPTENTTLSRSPIKSASQRLVACLRTLYLFAKIRPTLLVQHAITIQPYLSLKCQTQGDYAIIGVVARTLELVVPSMEHPSETFLAQLEEDSVKLIIQHDRTVITSCLALLGSIVNTVTKNYKLIRDCFNKYYSFVVDYKKLHMNDPGNPRLEQYKPYFRRTLYTVGLLLRHFDFNEDDVRGDLSDDITTQVAETLMYFMDFTDMDIRFSTLQAIGFVCIRHYELLMGDKLRLLYHSLMLNPNSDLKLRIQCLQNIENFLQEEEAKMVKQDRLWSEVKTKENLKEMCDLQSGMASAIIQIYLKQVLECVIAAEVKVRHSALRVIQLVLGQGLVHPVQIVPYLVCMSSDSEEVIAHTADKQLQEIEKKYPGFIAMKAMQGFRLSYRLQVLIQNVKPTRGFRQKDGEYPGALNGFLYSVMRTTKQQRRAVAISLLKQFDEMSRASLLELLYIADNVAYFPYQVLDEPLFVMHHIDIIISVTGANLLQSFKESLLPSPNAIIKYNPETQRQEYIDDDDEDDGDVDSLLSRLPPNLTPLVEWLFSSQGCLLLLMLKDHLKHVFGLSDGKINEYSPSDTTKQFEKSASRKSTAKFNPKAILVRLQENRMMDPLNMSDKDKLELVTEYLDFKALMLKIDDPDEDSDVETQKTSNHIDAGVTTRVLRGAQQNSTCGVAVLPDTHEGWKDQPKEPYINSVDVQDPKPLENKHSPIKPLTIRTPRNPLKEARAHHQRNRTLSHKKHKKKKKKRKRRLSDSDDEESDSDPDWT